VQGLGLAALRSHAPKLQQDGRIARLYRQDPLQQLLKFSFAIGIALPLNLLGQQVESAQVLGIDLDGFAELDDSLRRIPTLALKHAQQIVDLVVLGSQLLGATQPLGCHIEVSLAQGKNAPVRPTRGLSFG
jgi:hypothetical protein